HVFQVTFSGDATIYWMGVLRTARKTVAAFPGRMGSYSRELLEERWLVTGCEMAEPAQWSPIRECEMQKTALVRISVVLFALLLVLGTSVWAQKLADRPRAASMRSLA